MRKDQSWRRREFSCSLYHDAACDAPGCGVVGGCCRRGKGLRGRAQEYFTCESFVNRTSHWVSEPSRDILLMPAHNLVKFNIGTISVTIVYRSPNHSDIFISPTRVKA